MSRESIKVISTNTGKKRGWGGLEMKRGKFTPEIPQDLMIGGGV